VADDFSGLEIVDLRAAGVPVLAGRYDTPGRAVGVAVGDAGVAFVADLNRGVQVVDVGNPAKPALIRNIPTEGAANAVALDGDRLYVADGFTGLLEIDVSNPAAPVTIGVYDTPGEALAVTPFGGFAYVADGEGGLRVVRPNPPLPPAVSGGPTAIGQTIPAGFTPGPYDVQVAGPDGAVATLPNGFGVCGERVLDVSLQPVTAARAPTSTVPAPARTPAPTPATSWTVAVEGDPGLFPAGTPASVRLLLPALPAGAAIDAGPGPSAIDLRFGPGGGVSVHLTGPDPAAARARWDRIAAAGGIDLPLAAGVTGAVGVAGGVTDPLALALYANRGQGAAPAHYLFEFDGDRLVSARAWGSGADLRFEAGGVDDLGCETRKDAGLAAALAILGRQTP
jgi:hypothetical protein